jgi:hypothetical protein
LLELPTEGEAVEDGLETEAGDDDGLTPAAGDEDGLGRAGVEGDGVTAGVGGGAFIVTVTVVILGPERVVGQPGLCDEAIVIIVALVR